ncbi:MAG: hypothetical protein AAFR95_13185 [Bacteroidota bacterium]
MSKLPFSVYDTFAYLSSGLLLVAGVGHALGVEASSVDLTLEATLVAVVVLYVIGHLVAHVAGLAFENVLVRRWLGSPETHLFNTAPKRFAARIFRYHFKPFPATTQERLQRYASEAGYSADDRGFFFHCHNIALRDEIARERLSSFLNLYGFCRNAGLALLVAGLAMLLAAFDLDARDLGENGRELLCIGLLALVAAFGLFVRYLKFFRHYTTEVYQAALASTKTTGETSN